MNPTISELIQSLNVFDVYERIAASSELLDRVAELKQLPDLLPLAVKTLSVMIFGNTRDTHNALKILTSLGPLAVDALPYLIESLRYCHSNFFGQTKSLTIYAIIAIGEKSTPDLIELARWQIPRSGQNVMDTLYRMAAAIPEEIRLALNLKPPAAYIDPDIDFVEPALPVTLEHLKFMMKSFDLDTRINAARLLKSIEGNLETKKMIFCYLFSDQHPQVRGTALRSMTADNVTVNFALPVISGMLNDDSNYVRWEAVCALSNHFHAHAEPLIPKLKRMLFEDVPRVQDTILHAFKKMAAMVASEAPLLFELLEMKRAGYYKMSVYRVLIAMGPAASAILEPLKLLQQSGTVERDLRGYLNMTIKAIEGRTRNR